MTAFHALLALSALQAAPATTSTSSVPLPATEVPPGFAIERVYAVPLEEQGSWVCLTFDDRGRAITSDQFGALYRTDVLAPAEERTAERLQVDLGQAHGLLWAFDSLYVVVNAARARHSGLCRARDLDGDDVFETVDTLRLFDGSGEHGPHAVVRDGDALWVLGGNHTALPELDASRVPRVWAEDQLLERAPDPNGHAVGVAAPGGWLARTDATGERWELWAAGIRNAYDVAIHPSGDPLTFDSDMEWDVGLPWYRPTRILLLASGSDFGWRNGSGKWPADVLDSAPALCELGLGSPTGVLLDPALAFPAPWNEALFAADWTNGAIWAVHLAPDGAAYSALPESFVRGEGLPIADLATGPDGALYFVTGGRGTQSGLFRVRWTGEPLPRAADARTVGTGRTGRTGQTADTLLARQRRSLERMHGREPATIDAPWSALGASDPFVRRAARIALEHATVDRWRERALGESDLRTAHAALCALARVGGPNAATAVVQRVFELGLPASGDSLVDALRVVELALARADGDVRLDDDQLGVLLARFPTGDARTDRALATLLASQAGAHAAEVAPRLLERMRTSDTQEDALHQAWCLGALAGEWPATLQLEYLAWLDEAERTFAGGLSLARYLAWRRARFLESRGEERRIFLEAWWNARELERRRHAEPRPPRAFVERYTLDRLVAELPRVGSGRDFARGKALFGAASCADCHRFGGEGGADGPDLSGIGRRFQPRDLLRAIVDPSAAVSDQYQDTEVWTHDGDVTVGRLVEVDGARVLVYLRATRELVEIDGRDVEELRPHPLSTMPSGLLDTFEVDEILDLFAYLVSGGDPEHLSFEE
jgi:putative heme-binding domain-containing protein